MIYSSLDSSHQDESNDSKIIPIRAIFAEIAILQNFGSGQVRSSQNSEFYAQNCGSQNSADLPLKNFLMYLNLLIPFLRTCLLMVVNNLAQFEVDITNQIC